MRKNVNFPIIFIALIICNYSSPLSCQSSFDLDLFNACSLVDPVSPIMNNLSGICYNKDSETLFVIVNSGSIHEISLTGIHLREISFPGLGDPEGIAYMGNNKFAIAVEVTNLIELVTIAAAPDNSATSIGTIDPDIPFIIDGLEGITYDEMEDVLYVVNERIDMAIRKISHASTSNHVVTTPFNLENKAMTYTPKLSDAAGLAFSPMGNLLLLSQEGNVVIEVNPNTGNQISTTSLTVPLLEPEGITVISDQFIIIVGEPSQLLTSVRSGISCPPATVLPFIITQPKDVNICNVLSTTLSVMVNSADLYQWEQDSSSGFIPISDGPTFSGTNSNVLSITNLTGLDGYQYRCIVSNAMGRVITIEVQLFIDCSATCLTNIELTGIEDSSLHVEASSHIISNQLILSNAEVTYKAGNEITMLYNFEVKSGAIFNAFIDGCED